jgi:hypothetical protein
VRVAQRGIVPNRYGLLDKLEDVLCFIELKQQAMASEVNLENKHMAEEI